MAEPLEPVSSPPTDAESAGEPGVELGREPHVDPPPTPAWRKRIVAGFIACYLACLGWGVVAHALQMHVNFSVATYFVVWDMFCGWSSYSTRYHAIAEGESGRYYEVVPTPWEEFRPYGPLERAQLDTGLWGMRERIAKVLAETEHEPIGRVFLVEENWAKQYNLPESLWPQLTAHPRDPRSYYRLRTVFDGESNVLFAQGNFLGQQMALAVGDNPRLQADMRAGQPFYAVKNSQSAGSYRGGNTLIGPTNSTFLSPHGN